MGGWNHILPQSVSQSISQLVRVSVSLSIELLIGYKKEIFNYIGMTVGGEGGQKHQISVHKIPCWIETKSEIKYS